jgi:hypothetical protein
MKPNGTYYVLVNKDNETYKLIDFDEPELTIVFDTLEEAEEELKLQNEINFIEEDGWHIEKRYIDFDKELKEFEDTCRKYEADSYTPPWPFNIMDWPGEGEEDLVPDKSVEELKALVKEVETDYHCEELDSLVNELCLMNDGGELSDHDYDYILDHLDEFTNLE